MIKLVVDKWCENCNEFEADTEVDVMSGVYDYAENETPLYYNTTVRCVHRDRCNSMVKHIRKELKKANG